MLEQLKSIVRRAGAVMLDASEKERVRFLLSFDKPGKERKCV